MEKIKIVLKWVLGIVFIIIGIALLGVPIPGIVLILIGLFVLPPIFKIIDKKIEYKFTSKIKWSVIVIGFFIMVFAISYDASTKNLEKGNFVISKASNMIDNGKLDSALILIEEAKALFNSTENKALDLENEIAKSKDLDFAKEILSKMTDDDFSSLKEGNLDKVYLSHNKLNSTFIELLKENAHERKLIIEKLKAQKEQERIDEEIRAIKEQERIDKEEKAEKEQKRIDEENKLHKNWYSGGTLHSASISTWKSATERNKLATCADFVASIKKQNGGTYNNLEQMKRDAIEMQKCIDEAIKGDVKINSKISEIAVMCSILLNK